MAHIFIFQLGPVQSFIAAGRRTQDLYVGSRILSELAAAAWRAAKAASMNFVPIFPMPLADGNLPKGVPHRLSFVSDGDPDTVARAVRGAVNARWETIADMVRDETVNLIQSGDWVKQFDRQKAGWIEFYWVALPVAEEKYGAALARANAALAARKLYRHLPQVLEPGQKCTLTGSQQALIFDWGKLKEELHDSEDIVFRQGERLGTVAYVKRLAQKFGCDLGSDMNMPPSTRFIAGINDIDKPDNEISDKDPQGDRQEGYIAVLAMDGDNMGKTLSRLEEIGKLQEFSEKLSQFADKTVPEIVNKYGGTRHRAQLIYAGGDDVLALFPLILKTEEIPKNDLTHNGAHPFIPVLDCARALRNAFFEMTMSTGSPCTASAGIAIASYDFPLDAALEMARLAEEKAKEEYDRDALVVAEAHGGAIREAGGKWDALDLVKELFGHFRSETLSGKVGYDLLTVARDLTGEVPEGARKAEVLRLLRRRTKEGADENTKVAIDKLAAQIATVGDAGGKPETSAAGHVLSDSKDRLEENWRSVAHWAILARFLAQPTREEQA